jgi:hypothetical protein
VRVDDDPACDDEAADVICTQKVSVGECLVNVAAGGIADQSSQLGLFTPDLALNGNLGDFTHTLAGNEGLGPAIWEVDLLEDRDIARIVLYNRTSCCGSRLRDIIVSVHDVAFFDDDPPLGTTADDLPIWDSAIWESELLNPENELGAFPLGPTQLVLDVFRDEGEPVVGRYLRVTRLADDDLSGTGGIGNADESTVLSLAEVAVLECPEGSCADKPRVELLCGDGIDNDGDGAVDCDDSDCSGEGGGAGIAPECVGGPRFVRGDADASGGINLTDGVNILLWSFQGGPEPACLDAADTDDTGSINLSDPIRIFQWLFLGGVAPVDPEPSGAAYAGADCGIDPTDDDPFGCQVAPGPCA